MTDETLIQDLLAWLERAEALLTVLVALLPTSYTKDQCTVQLQRLASHRSAMIARVETPAEHEE